MNILFVSYWGINEGLTVATVDPHLEVLSGFKHVNKIILTTIEREDKPVRKLNILKVRHISIYSGTSFIDKYRDYTSVPNKLLQLCEEHAVDTIICRGAPAGALGYLVWKKTNIPFYVESFEPHAEYMRESGVWKRWDLRYLLSRYWEEKQKQHAKGLMPVAKNYRKKLISEGVPEDKIMVLPCTVDVDKFKFDQEKRKEVREKLIIKDQTIVGIYVGKYGGMYMDQEAFNLYRQAFDYWHEFYLIILSPEEHHLHIEARVREFKLPSEKVYVQQADHFEIPAYLSSADFAFATYNPGKSKAYLSPIKIGEYWASGLPVVLTKGVGDDAEIITKEHIGVLISNEHLGISCIELEALSNILNNPLLRKQIPVHAKKYRSRKIIGEVYSYFLEVSILFYVILLN
ncbi:glycosyltransferase [Catalinimonas niigatensis]|uniref:glycosyltransferase n=1 Tax=Catalinimonas niigatensis TaxID=1397264 RepID=UPI002665B28C|nr:glycosyltransferase [Catalinimonas niigatensis]WPP52611.1 glycosyltransferase [Catalinimonas niigatensis]